MYVTSKDGTRIGYDKSGKGPLVVMVNGAFGHRGYYGGEELAKELSREFTVVVYDRRGRGESTDTQPFTVEREIEDIEALIDANGGQAFLYGESSGAALAVRAAAQLTSKVTKLALFEPPYDTGEDAKSDFLKARKQLEDFRVADKRDEMVKLFMSDFMPPEALEDFRQNSPDEWKTLESVAPTLTYDYATLDDGLAPIELAKEISIPVLVLNGSKGLPFIHEALDQLTAALPNAERKTLEGQEHTPTPEVLAPVLTEFFIQQK